MNGLVPIHALDPERAVAPKASELVQKRLLRQAVSPDELFARRRSLLCRLSELLLPGQLQRGLAQARGRDKSLRYPCVPVARCGDLVRGFFIRGEAGYLANAGNGGFRQFARARRRHRLGLAKVTQIKLGVRGFPAPGRQAYGFNLAPTGWFAFALHLGLINLDCVPSSGRLGEESCVIPAFTALEVNAEVGRRQGVAAQHLELNAPAGSQVQLDGAVPRGSLDVAGRKIAGQAQDLTAIEQGRRHW